MLQGSQLLFQCSYHDDAGSYGSLTVYVDAVSGAGTYESSNAYLQEYSPGESTHGYSSSDPQSGANYPCSVVIDSFDPRDKGGMSARFSCPHLVDSFDEKSAAGSVLLLPRAGHDAGAPPDAGGLNEAGAPSCVLHAHGAYEADTVGYGDNYRCYTYASDGTSFSYSPGAAGVTTGYVGVGAAWCTTCGIDYSGGKCTLDVEVDEGIGGRFAASFTCTGLVGGDGTTESVDGRIDGTHMRPPD
jgi:hypothetical protein